jgi:hypothetical protein
MTMDGIFLAAAAVAISGHGVQDWQIIHSRRAIS